MNLEGIKMIEQRSKDKVISLLQTHGLGKNRKNKWREYSIAKKIIFERQFINCDIYDKQIGWICDYLKL